MTNGIYPNDGSHKYKEELETLRESVRRLVGDLDTFIAAKGRHNTAVAYERLVASRAAFLAENKEFETK